MLPIARPTEIPLPQKEEGRSHRLRPGMHDRVHTFAYPSEMAQVFGADSREAPREPDWSQGARPGLRAWEPIRGPLERWPNFFDFLLALLSFLLTLAMWGGLAMDTLVDVGVFVCAFVGNFALLWRRSHPVQVHMVALLASIVVQLTPQTDGVFALAFSLYSLGRYAADDRASLVGMLVALTYVGIDVFVLSTPSVGSVIAAGLVMLLWYVGRRLRFRGEYLRLLEERAMHLERERSADAERAVAIERTRIARELHDIVAHQVSLMTVQAGAARTVAVSDPEAATQAMAAVEKAGRQALTEMRHLLDVLRPGKADDELGPQPGAADLSRLVEEVGEAGPIIRLTTSGPLRGLPARVDLAVYRIVQEALTNVLKHAGPTPRVEVSVRAEGNRIEVRVCDDGQGEAVAGGGHGIDGMRERVELLGGALSVGPGENQGFEVCAYLPVEAGGQ